MTDEQESLNVKISANMKLTRNLGDFNSVSIDLGMQRDLRPGENPQEALDKVYNFIERNVDVKSNQAVADLTGR